MPVLEVTTEKEARQKLQERVIRALLVAAGMGILYVFVSAYGMGSRETTPDTPDGQERYISERLDKGIILAFDPSRREMTVSEIVWLSLEQDERLELTYVAASVSARKNSDPSPKIRIHSNANRAVLATMDETTLNIR